MENEAKLDTFRAQDYSQNPLGGRRQNRDPSEPCNGRPCLSGKCQQGRQTHHNCWWWTVQGSRGGLGGGNAILAADEDDHVMKAPPDTQENMARSPLLGQ